MAWNQRRHRDRWAAVESHPVAGTHIEHFARSRLANSTEFVRGDTSSSWTLVPKQEVESQGIRGLWERKQKWSRRQAQGIKCRRERKQNWNAWMPNKPVGRKSKRHPPSEQTTVPCSSGASFRPSINESYSVCSRSTSLFKIWTVWDAAAVESRGRIPANRGQSQPPRAASVFSRLHVARTRRATRSQTNAHPSSIGNWQVSEGAVSRTRCIVRHHHLVLQLELVCPIAREKRATKNNM